MAVIAQRQWDLLLIVTAAPHSNDVITTALRLGQAALDQEKTVRVWACGYANMLTQNAHGTSKPVNTRDTQGTYPSSAEIVRRMLAENPGRLSWIACTACSAERGATDHISEIRYRSPARFLSTIQASRRTVFIGGC
ncbi:DsrE family protein [Streptomyces sp. N2-109]|uniref:DsrE family protein n=1 Tax=Streptomyces gossypii TaxID=2883101 RepID=A0ABT2JP00_9ACTN|nr:DsrE family protein [Streptomyces gossypii]MCT2589605.1 DsrE family protein [Streptomyces gossypii]